MTKPASEVGRLLAAARWNLDRCAEGTSSGNTRDAGHHREVVNQLINRVRTLDDSRATNELIRDLLFD